MSGINIKGKIENNVREAVKEFCQREDILTDFGDPIIAYVNTRDQLFNKFFDVGLTEHPKNIWRPGNTLIMYFVPFPEDVIMSNRGGEQISPQWRRATIEAAWLAMKLNRVIRQTLNIVGRLSSLLNTQLDWNEKNCLPRWSHKLAAYAAGMGEMGPAGSFHTEAGFGGCLNGVATDGKYIEESEPLDDEKLNEIYRSLINSCCYKEAENVSCSDEMIKACPAAAISRSGIDRRKCQEYCKTIDEYIPSPDVCGKCFFCK